MKTIVIIEDDESVRISYGRIFRAFKYPYELLFLPTLDEAEAFLENELPNRPDIVAITFDGSMIPGKRALNTLHLVQLAKETNFPGILLACSSDDFYCDLLVEKGCTHKVSCKSRMHEELTQLLS